jgi:hypothetical protein
MVLYYRPAPRSSVIQSLVTLGMFVTEVDCGREHSAWPSRYASADVAIAFVDDTPSHRAVMTVVSQQFGATLAVLPPCPLNTSLSGYPADEAVRERAEEFGHIERGILRVGQLARSRNQGLAHASDADVPVFGGLSFRSNQRWLGRWTEVVSLSPVEHGILRALVSANGSVVSKELLLQELSGNEVPASDGYLKTVVLRIRRKAERLGGDASLLSSIRGFGYLLKT